MSEANKLTPSEIRRIKLLRAWTRARPILLFALLALLVILIWLGSISYIRHGLPGTHPTRNRLEMLAQIGEAMTITNVLFAGLGFIALIATVWFQRKQVESAIEGMSEQSSELARQALHAMETVDVLRTQSAATSAAAQISALALLIPIKEQTLDVARHNANLGVSDRLTVQLPTLEKEQDERMLISKGYLSG